ncbi:hypothetical protein BS47DRAFT_1354503 [Hydnum rufescens UP504]|uniref:Uncharacterized protein n=1 Tax=Hydnum rufescens UP504 TaxID=1448309 RepID=A0A9P6DK83_9AGAM|nr:hypothetical protein BS47DRAFT_1354503 [Hydnum rufescens UP504]
MLVSLALLFGLSSFVLVSATPTKRVVAYINPAGNGGSMLDSSAGLGEPLNIIVSGLSSSDVLNIGGLENWAKSIQFTTTCFGVSLGGSQTANLGDGQGWVSQLAVLRYDFGDPGIGSCLESLAGGNHFRFWKQSTTGAYFLASSVEKWAGENHNIVPNGYDLGRDNIVSSIVGSASNGSGTTSYNGVTYLNIVEYVSGLLTPGSSGINHGISIDGRVAVITVTIQ